MTFWFWVLWEFELCVGRVADPTFWIRFRCYPPVKRIRIRTSIKSGSGSNIFFTVGYHSLKLLNSQLKLSAMATIFSLSIFWIRVRLFWPNPEPDFSKSIYQDMSKSSGSRVSAPGDGFSKPESTNLSGSGVWQKKLWGFVSGFGYADRIRTKPFRKSASGSEIFPNVGSGSDQITRIRISLCRRLTGFILE